MSRRPAWALALVLLAGVGAAPASAADLAFTSPLAHGVTGLGDTVTYALTGPCDAAQVVAVVTGSGARVESPAADGCAGEVAVPDAERIASAGLAEHQVEAVQLEARREGAQEAAATASLSAKRLAASRGRVVEGAGSVAPSHDPMNGGDSLELTGERASVALGPVDLTGVSSLSFRLATPDAGTRLCGGPGQYCVAGRLLVTEGSATGPLVTTAEVPNRGGWHDWTRIVQEVLPRTPASASGPVELFVTAVSARCGAAATPDSPFGRCGDDERLLNLGYVELNGSGVTVAPQRPAAADGAVDLLADGLEGWSTSGLGHFQYEDGVVTANGSFGRLWYSAREFGDFVLDLDFRVAGAMDNSGVYVRTAAVPQTDPLEVSGYELQVQDYGETYPGSAEGSQTGAAYGVQPADRINTRSYGEWNHYRITAVGQQYTVELNGTVVNRFTGDKLLSGFLGLQSHDPQSRVSYRDIVVTPL